MKKTAMIVSTLALLLGLLAGCGGGTQTPAETNKPAAQETQAPPDEQPAVAAENGYADGVYYAEGAYAEKSGWKEIVALKVEGGKIVDVNWNGLHRDGGLDKKSVSADGKYGMVANGGASSEWHEQAAEMEKYLLDKQSLADIALNDEGKTDAVSSVSIGIGGFVELVGQALEAGPVEAGPYKDGAYTAEEPEFDAHSGWKYIVTVTVMNGNIVAAEWNGVHKDGGADKITQSANGEYGMVAKGGASAEWHEQARAAEQYLVEKGDPAAIVYDQEKLTTDAISGVTVKVDAFVQLTAKALENAK